MANQPSKTSQSRLIEIILGGLFVFGSTAFWWILNNLNGIGQDVSAIKQMFMNDKERIVYLEQKVNNIERNMK